MRNTITKNYKKAHIRNGEKFNEKGINFVKQAGISDNIEMNGTGNSFVILKDQKEKQDG